MTDLYQPALKHADPVNVSSGGYSTEERLLEILTGHIEEFKKRGLELFSGIKNLDDALNHPALIGKGETCFVFEFGSIEAFGEIQPLIAKVVYRKSKTNDVKLGEPVRTRTPDLESVLDSVTETSRSLIELGIPVSPQVQLSIDLEGSKFFFHVGVDLKNEGEIYEAADLETLSISNKENLQNELNGYIELLEPMRRGETRYRIDITNHSESNDSILAIKRIFYIIVPNGSREGRLVASDLNHVVLQHNRRTDDAYDLLLKMHRPS